MNYLINVWIAIFIIIMHHIMDALLYQEDTDYAKNIEYSFFYSVTFMFIGIFLPFQGKLDFVWFGGITFLSTVLVTEYTKLHFLCIIQLLVTYLIFIK